MLKRFCGMKLNTSGVVIGWVGAAYSFLLTILLIFAIANLDDILKTFEKNGDPLPAQGARFAIEIALSVYLALNVINLTASALLVAGTIKERHLMLTPWLINSGISLFLSGLYCLISIFALIGGGGADMTFGGFIFLAISFSIQFYIWAAVYSLYKELRANVEQSRLMQVEPQSPSYTKI